MWKSKKDEEQIQSYIESLGFSTEAARLYAVLVEAGPLTLLSAARRAGIERTRLYRLSEKLAESGLIERVLEHKSQKIAACNLAEIERMVIEKKKEAERLDRELADFAKIVSSAENEKETQVRYYRGLTGIKQILWNETKAKTEIIGYLYRNLQEVVGKEYFSSYARALENNKVKLRDLRTESFLLSTKEKSYTRDPIEGGYWRFIPESILKLTHNMDVYDNVVVIYYFSNEEFFGIEIENPRIAEMQRSMFEILWGVAASYKLPREYDRTQFKHLE